jgi:uncharacterized protein (TIGR03435 family)
VTPTPTLSPLGDQGGAPGSVIAKLGRAVSAQKLSDTGGVDFSSYIQRIQSDVGRNGAPLAPSNASRLSKSGVVAIRLVLLPDGKIGATKLEQSSGNADLDKTAWYAITSKGTFPPLPSAFRGPEVELLLKFFYNTDVVEPSASLVPVAMVESHPAPSPLQNTAAPSPRYEYEAATIKPSQGPGPYKKVGLWAAPDGFNAWFVKPQQIISIAYGVESFQFSGGPSWLSSERFDIQAKMDAATTGALTKLSQAQRVLAQQQMLQALLADRFQLTAHRETKEGTIYTLVIAKGGPKLQEAKLGDPGADNMTSKASGDLTAQAVPIARLVRNLTQMLGHPVLDKTELKGVYDFKLQFTPDDRLQSTSPLAPNARLPEPPADSNAPSLFDALQEQLGLKLESEKGPVEVIVIDHVERPSGN